MATADGDVLDNLLDDPLILCAGNLRTIAFTTYKTCEGGEMSQCGQANIFELQKS